MTRTIVFGTLILMHGFGRLGIAHAQSPQVEGAAVPGYPQLPSGGRESGEVLVEVTISPTGDVVGARALSGPERLRAVAEGAAQKWRFRAHSGPVEKWTITFAFTLRQGVGDPPLVAGIFTPPNRVEVFAAYREIVTLADPAMEIEKARKKKQHK